MCALRAALVQTPTVYLIFGAKQAHPDAQPALLEDVRAGVGVGGDPAVASALGERPRKDELDR